MLINPLESKSDDPILLLPFLRLHEADAGNGPVSIASGDFDLDGNLDIASYSQISRRIAILCGDGDGNFSVIDEIGQQILDGFRGNLLATDLNEDGIKDLVATNFTSNQLILFLGNGDGTFSVEEPLQTGNSPHHVLAVDFNDDGYLDLAAANFSSDDVSVFLGNESGYHSAMNFDTGFSPRWMASGDFNGDGVPDLATDSSLNDAIYVLPGVGDGTFLPKTEIAVGKSPQSLVARDFNSDGFCDLAVGGFPISVLLSDGNNSFETEFYALGERAAVIESEDINDDGVMDLVATMFGEFNVSVFIGVGDGTFNSPDRYLTNREPNSIAIADFDNDKLKDIIVCNFVDDNLTVLLGIGGGEFNHWPSDELTEFPVGQTPYNIDSGDFNLDGFADLVAASNSDNSVSILLGDGGGSFSAAQQFVTSDILTDVLAADLNDDGNPDLLGTIANGNLVESLIGDGNGSFSKGQQFQVGQNPVASCIADFNSDGLIDIAVANRNSMDVSILTGTGGGNFAKGYNVPVNVEIVSLICGDLNNDGVVDLMTANFSPDSVAVILGNGDGTFGAPVFHPTFDPPTDLCSGDFNGDGNLDVAASVMLELSFSSHNVVRVFVGDGFGNLSVFNNNPTLHRPRFVIASDFNLDGYDDIATTKPGRDSISILLRNPDSSFYGRRDTPTGDMPGELVVADFNNDGFPDIATANTGANTVSISLNVLPRIGDVNLDGHVDLLDVAPFVELIQSGQFQFEADINQDGTVDQLDVKPMIILLRR